MKSGADVPSVAFLDTNFLVSCFFSTDRFHRDAKTYLWHMRRATYAGDSSLFTSPQVIEETLWLGCRALYDVDHGAGASRFLPQDEQFSLQVHYRDQLQQLAHQLLSDRAPYTITPMRSHDMSLAVDFATTYGVPLTDACHCALALRLCHGNIVTDDRHMERIPEVNCLPYIAPRP